jgi:hypothetical protein
VKVTPVILVKEISVPGENQRFADNSLTNCTVICICIKLSHTYSLDMIEWSLSSCDAILITYLIYWAKWGRRGCWCWEFESRSGRSVQHYVIKFVSDLRPVGGFLRVIRFHPPIITEILLKVALNIIAPYPIPNQLYVAMPNNKLIRTWLFYIKKKKVCSGYECSQVLGIMCFIPRNYIIHDILMTIIKWFISNGTIHYTINS